MKHARHYGQKFVSKGYLIAFGTGLIWLILFLPLYRELAANAWLRDENAHAPLLLCFCVGAIAVRMNSLRRRSSISALLTPTKTDQIVGAAVFSSGLVAYFFGRVEDVELLATASQLPTAIGIVLILGGGALLRGLWFPIVMLAYLIVWPGWVLDQLTSPLKLWISAVTADILSVFDLPVAHSGVTLAVGPYRLLIADACAGLNSLLSLTSIGAIYLYVTRQPGIARNASVLLMIIPIAICANLCRVILLVLITYYGGYDAGQGFLHELAGFFMFAVALILIFCIDGFTEWLRGARAVRTQGAPA